MLGWGINIYKASEPETSNWKDCIATWECGLDGADWIRENCEEIERNSGYPVKYKTTGKLIKQMLKNGAVKYVSDTNIIHEEEGFAEEAGKTGWIGRERVDFERLKNLDDSEIIVIDTWDLS